MTFFLNGFYLFILNAYVFPFHFMPSDPIKLYKSGLYALCGSLIEAMPTVLLAKVALVLPLL